MARKNSAAVALKQNEVTVMPAQWKIVWQKIKTREVKRCTIRTKKKKTRN
jgi:hypothetical protein